MLVDWLAWTLCGALALLVFRLFDRVVLHGRRSRGRSRARLRFQTGPDGWTLPLDAVLVNESQDHHASAACKTGAGEYALVCVLTGAVHVRVSCEGGTSRTACAFPVEQGQQGIIVSCCSALVEPRDSEQACFFIQHWREQASASDDDDERD